MKSEKEVTLADVLVFISKANTRQKLSIVQRCCYALGESELTDFEKLNWMQNATCFFRDLRQLIKSVKGTEE